MYYYRGLFKVKVVTQSEGYWIAEAQEDFEDNADGEKVPVKAGERRIVPPSELHKKKRCRLWFLSTLYERRLEKKVKHMVEEYEKEKKTIRGELLCGGKLR